MILLYPFQQVSNQSTARDISELVWSHAYHDARKVGKTYGYGFAGALAAFIAVGAMASQADNAQSFVSHGLTLANLSISGLMGLAYYETRKKKQWFCDLFNDAAQRFGDRDTKLTSKFKNEIFSERPGISDYFLNIKRHPIQAGMALTFATATFVTSQPAVLAIGATCFMFTVLAEEESKTKAISTKAHRAKQMIETCNKLTIGIEP